ncbi:acetyltransferase [Siminovitchia sediminis]|uniref:Acetyltransferase n=1 Tax=Siminovitchia sediminis TaxID=1274353 RepID=A0ABW4KJ23_9BACI
MKIAMIGGGGHSKVIRELIHSIKEGEMIACLDDKYHVFQKRKDLICGPIEKARYLIQMYEGLKFVIAIGHNKTRKRIVDQLQFPAHYYAILKHPTSWVSPSAEIGYGSVIMAHTVINPDTKIGEHTIINTKSVVEHDSRISQYVHISPNATLTGGVKIGEGAHIGAGATIIPGVKIGKWAMIGAGATVIHSIPPDCTAVGVPAKVKKVHMKEGV